MSAKSDLETFCKTRLAVLDDLAFANFTANAMARLLSDFNVGQVFSSLGPHYLVPNPSQTSTTHDEFHDLRQKWQAEESVG